MEINFKSTLSGWTIKDLNKLGYSCKGLAGLKFFYYSQNAVHSLLDGDVFANYRFRPKKLFYLINAACQIISFYFPMVSFGLFGVKKKMIRMLMKLSKLYTLYAKKGLL